MNEFQPIINQMQAHVITKADADPAFKAALLANPRAALEAEFKVELPALVQFQVQEAPANTVVITLPRVAAVAADGELSDSDLESVAGGSKSGAANVFKKIGSGLGVGAASAAIIPLGTVGEGKFGMDVANITLDACF